MKKLLFTLTILMSSLTMSGQEDLPISYYFEAHNIDGVLLGYKVISDSTVSITYRHTSDENIICYEGILNIPAQVSYDNHSYKVVDMDSTFVYPCNTYLTGVSIPNSMTEITINALSNTSLSEIFIPNSVTSIEGGAFAWCDKLKKITISNSVDTIGYKAFSNTSPDTIFVSWQEPILISSDVFYNVKKYLCTLVVPNGTKTAYKNSPVWKEFKIIEEAYLTDEFVIEDGILIRYNGNGGDIVIPDNITGINWNLFSNDTTITSVVIPKSVKWTYNAFWNCESLTSAIINAETIEGSFMNCPNLTSVVVNSSQIGYGSFSSCPNLTSVILGNNVSTIDSSFVNCTALKFIDIPQSVTNLGWKSFSGCVNLDTVKVFWDNPLLLEEYSNVFNNVDMSSCVLSIPKGTKEVYQTATIWKDFNIVERESILEDNIIIEPQQYSVTITWQQIPNVSGYTLTIYSDAALTQVVCTIYFNDNGIVVNVFKTTSVDDYFYTVDDLLSGTTYYYELAANGIDNEVIDVSHGNFSTLSDVTTDISNKNTNDCIIYAKNQLIFVENAENQLVEIININGRMLVNKTVASTVEQFFVPNKGIYIVIVENKSQKILVQ